jgi:hypothetical protein
MHDKLSPTPMRRSLVLANSLLRIAYGVAAFVSPRAMASAQLVPDLEKRHDARLFVRGFGGHMVGVGALGIASAWRPELERPAMELAIAIDLFDIASVVLEARDRGSLDEDLMGGLVLSGAGAVTACAALLMSDDRAQAAAAP